MPPAPRKVSARVLTSPACLPFLQLYSVAETEGASRWQDVEDRFINAMWAFDQMVTNGTASQGDVQNGKGDFLTDLIALILENASGKKLWGRGAVPGLFYRRHLLDAFYPPEGTVEVLIETKALGAPPNPRQKNRKARPASQDLKKRLTELAFKTIDLKAEYARHQGRGEGPAGDLKTWLRRAKPSCALFLAVRAADAIDLRATLDHANVAKEILDSVGLLAYSPHADGSGYTSLEVPVGLELDRALSQVATHLRSL